MFVQDLVKPSVKEEADQVVEKLPDQPLAVEFLDQIIHRFGLPNSIIIDLGTQFTGSAFWDFCDERSIVVKYVLVAHPRANGQVERANGTILDALKKRLYRENDKAPSRWLKELPSGDCEPSPVATLALPHISWSMAQKQYSLQISLSDHRVLRTLLKTDSMKHGNSRSTALKNDGLTLVCV
jgi:transposase InsO family protein